MKCGAAIQAGEKDMTFQDVKKMWHDRRCRSHEESLNEKVLDGAIRSIARQIF